MNEVCMRCSLYATCAGLEYDPAECECVENMYIKEIDSEE